MKIAVVTTFPLSYWDLCAREMIASFDRFWPKEIDLFLKFDMISNEELKSVDNWLKKNLNPDRAYFMSNGRTNEQAEFLARNVDKGNDYAFQAVRFSHKVYALSDTVDYVQNDYDWLIWLDADVITNKIISEQVLMSWLQDDVVCLDRKDAPHSECGFVAYNLRTTGHEIIKKMVAYYNTDAVYKLSGWTDCHVFDEVKKDYFVHNLSENLPGWHVWPISPLGKYMEHRKGNRKVQKQEEPKQEKKLKNISLDTLNLPTKNCIDGELIRNQVRENVAKIRNWVQFCTPTDEEVVVVSAGPSLNRDDLMPFVERGVKIVAVKHACDRLKEWGIKPWAVILLDPRAHVEKFVQAPDPDVIYFVSSMVHPSVVDTLIKSKARLVGYHAHVNVDFSDILQASDPMVCGGTATATRCLGMLKECLGFSKFHLFAYDLCLYTKPDLTEKHPDGNPKYIELTLDTQTWGNKTVSRTFWTEPQFLAQAKELADLYKFDQQFTIAVYGDGIARWQYVHHKMYKSWHEKYAKNMIDNRRLNINVNEWANAIT